MTARDLIKGSLRLIRALASGETPSAESLQDGLDALNQMIASWSTDKAIIYTVAIEEFTLSSGNSSRTMGTGGNFNTTRPQRIEYAFLKENGIETPIKILNDEEWAKIASKSETGDPTKMLQKGSYPLETLLFWPIPSATKTLVLHSWKPLTEIASVNADLSFPTGYERALKYNLACEIADEYGKTPSARVERVASASKAAIERMNFKPEFIGVDSAMVARGGGFDINTGE